MHSVFEEFLLILANFPAILSHLSAEFIQTVRIILLRVSGSEFPALTCCQCLNLLVHFPRKLAGLTQNHIPDGIREHLPAIFTLFHKDNVHKGKILHILRERSHKWRISHLRPDISDLVEKFHQELVRSQRLLSIFHFPFV